MRTRSFFDGTFYIAEFGDFLNDNTIILSLVEVVHAVAASTQADSRSDTLFVAQREFNVVLQS